MSALFLAKNCTKGCVPPIVSVTCTPSGSGASCFRYPGGAETTSAVIPGFTPSFFVMAAIAFPSATGDDKLVAVGVFENGECAPGLGLRVHGEFYAPGLQLLDGGLHVIAPEGERLESADAILVALGREQRQERVGAGNFQFDPALLAVKRLVGGDFEAEFLGGKLQRRVLVPDRNACHLDAADHLSPPCEGRILSRDEGCNQPVIAILSAGIA